MAVSFVGNGAIARGTDNSVEVSSPAGSVGDLLIAFMFHDDWSDGAFSNSDGALTWTTIIAHDTATADDSRGYTAWAVEDQTGAREFTFGFTNVEGWVAMILRFSGQHGSVPIDVSESIIGSFTAVGEVVIPERGAMGIYAVMSDGTSQTYLDSLTPKGHTLIINDDGFYGTLALFRRAFGADDYPYPHKEHMSIEIGEFGNHNTTCTSFYCVIAPTISNATISGVTKDNDGSVLGSCETYLMKENAAGDEVMFVAKTTSHSGTGAYSFTVANDTDALFFVYSFKDGSPNVFDCTDHVLAPA